MTTTMLYNGRIIRSTPTLSGGHRISVEYRGKNENLEITPLNCNEVDPFQFTSELISLGIVGGE